MYIVDVREPDEFAQNHAQHAVNLPLSKLLNNPDSIKNLPKNQTIVVYCNSGNRSGQAQEILNSYGLINVVNGINQEYVQSHYST